MRCCGVCTRLRESALLLARRVAGSISFPSAHGLTSIFVRMLIIFQSRSCQVSSVWGNATSTEKAPAEAAWHVLLRIDGLVTERSTDVCQDRRTLSGNQRLRFRPLQTGRGLDTKMSLACFTASLFSTHVSPNDCFVQMVCSTYMWLLA